jgi:hypothetical protein
MSSALVSLCSGSLRCSTTKYCGNGWIAGFDCCGTGPTPAADLFHGIIDTMRADLLVKGMVRKVICWPNRNGFLLRPRPSHGRVLWAKGLTSAGRPILADVAKVSTAGGSTRPGIAGGANWQNPAFNQKRGSIFILATESSSVFTKLPWDRIMDGGWNRLYIGSGWS